MTKNECVAKFLDAISSVWGRDLSPGAVQAYLEVADPYSDAIVAASCDMLLKGASQFPLPVDLRNALKQLATRFPIRLLPDPVEQATPEQIRKCVNAYLAKHATGNPREKDLIEKRVRELKAEKPPAAPVSGGGKAFTP